MACCLGLLPGLFPLPTPDFLRRSAVSSARAAWGALVLRAGLAHVWGSSGKDVFVFLAHCFSNTILRPKQAKQSQGLPNSQCAHHAHTQRGSLLFSRPKKAMLYCTEPCSKIKGPSKWQMTWSRLLWETTRGGTFSRGENVTYYMLFLKDLIRISGHFTFCFCHIWGQCLLWSIIVYSTFSSGEPLLWRCDLAGVSDLQALSSAVTKQSCVTSSSYERSLAGMHSRSPFTQKAIAECAVFSGPSSVKVENIYQKIF